MESKKLNTTNVLLINPTWGKEEKGGVWKKVASSYPSLGLANIAAVLLQNNINVMIKDMCVEKVDFKSLNFDSPSINADLYLSDFLNLIISL